MTYDVDYFIKKFKAIPENKWTIHKYKDNDGNCCALGHCGETTIKRTSESIALTDIFISHFSVIDINDNHRALVSKIRSLHHPKLRILKALELIKQGKRIHNVKPHNSNN